MSDRKFAVLIVFFALLIPAAAAPASGQEAGLKVPAKIVEAVKNTDYASVRIKNFPVAVQCWSYRKYTFLETLDRVGALGIKYLQAFPGQTIGKDFPGASFDHNTLTSAETRDALKKRIQAAGLKVVAYGVTDIGRTEPEMRKAFDFARDMGIRTIVCEPQDADFPAIEKLVREYDICIAIHNHPAPSKYWSPVTALEHIKGLDERIGVCADTGHWMRENMDPVECLRLLKGRVIDVHLKDRSDHGKGPAAFDVAWGDGKGNMRSVLAELTLQDYPGFLTIEYENEEKVMTPEPDIKRSLAFIAGTAYYAGYEQLLKRSGRNYEKNGWNHYGPGYFELDGKTGVLKSQGGMGLLWYSARMYKDFILELDFKCSNPETNSGVFVRLPEFPKSDDYIYHSFEIQIDDSGKGIHRTGAVYDAEAPKGDMSLPTGRWNHMKITCRGKNIQIELNGKPVIDWQAEPRGKVKDFLLEGYIGLQNHDSLSPVYFRDIFIKAL